LLVALVLGGVVEVPTAADRRLTMSGANRRATHTDLPDPIDFSAVVRCRYDRVDIALRGELDTAGAPALVAAVAPLLSRTGLWVELDARELSFLGASGMWWIVKIRSLLRARGGELVVCSPSFRVRRLLDICGLTELLARDLAEVSGQMLLEA
jgi:anti-anti-sigma factor